MHPHDRARCLGSFGRELVRSILTDTRCTTAQLRPHCSLAELRSRDASLWPTWKSIRRSGNNDWWARFNDRVRLNAKRRVRVTKKVSSGKGCDLRRATVARSRLRSRRKRRASGSAVPRGVSRDNALIKCHESAPLCASAAWIYKYARRRPPFASPVNTPAWAPLATFNSAICTGSNGMTRLVNWSIFYNRLTPKRVQFGQ